MQEGKAIIFGSGQNIPKVVIQQHLPLSKLR
jgi:hypothetical protein